MTRTARRPARSDRALPWRILGIALACVAALVPIAAAMPPAGSPAVEATATTSASSDDAIVPSLLDKLDGQWMRRRALAGQGDAHAAANAGREITDLLRDEGMTRLEPLAAAAALEGQRELHAGNAANAVAAFELARTLDPHQAAAWWGEARARRQAGAGFGTFVVFAWHGVTARWGAYWPRVADLVQLGTVLLAALLLAGAAMVVTLVVSHGPELVHDVEERLPVSWHAAWRRAVGWALLLGPVAVQLLGAFALVVWAVVLAPVASRAERRALYAWLLVVALAAPAGGALWAYAAVTASPTAQVAVASAEHALRPDLLLQLEALAEAHPQDATWKVMTARLLAARYPDRAIRLLREAAQQAPADPRVQVALGNVYFASNKRETAAVFYAEAQRLDPRGIVPLFNLARVQATLMKTPEAEDMLRQARAIAPEEVRRLEATLPADGVADPVITGPEIGRKMLADEAAPAARRAMSFSNIPTLVALAALAAVLVLRLRPRRHLSHRCVRCGRAFCARCAGDDKLGGTCTACQQLFGRKEGLAPAARQEQARRVDRRIKLLARGRIAAQALWPGLALVHEGRTTLGLFEATAWAFFACGALLPTRLLPDIGAPGPWSASTVYVVLGVLFWIVAQLPAMRPSAADHRAGR